MALFSNITNAWFKLMANQLRMPSGLLAKITGNKMNASNKLLYHLTLNNLQVKDEDHILEIGFGNGKFFSELNAKANNLTISGMDHSPEMVKEAVRNNRDLHASGKLKTLAGSSDNMPFEDNSFDKIFCINVIYFWEKPALHLQEIHRVLKPGGFFCTGFRPKENLSKFPFAKHGFTLYTKEEWKNLLEENGFRFVLSQNGKHLEKKMNQENTPFESLCVVCVK
jgi:ubiquinone/menaquinone biosynthesis C-methylase UbiE